MKHLLGKREVFRGMTGLDPDRYHLTGAGPEIHPATASEEIHSSDDKIYYNITLDHEQAADGSLNKAEYRVERTQPIIENPKEYYMTISRFSVPAIDIPILIMPIVDNQPNPNLTPFKVTLIYGGTSFQQSVIYVSGAVTEPVPPAPIPVQQIDPESYYYWVYTYQRFIDMINTAIATAFAALKAAFPLAPQTEAPYFIYNSETELISLIAQYSYSQPGAIEFFINHELLTYMEAFTVEFYGRNPVTGEDAKMIIQDEGGLKNAYYPPGVAVPAATIPPAAPATPYYLEMKQEYKIVSSWTSFQDLVFTTGTIPIVAEWIQTSATEDGRATSANIMTDFHPTLQYAGDNRGNMVYFPTGPYRLINLNSTTPLRRFDFKVWWKDKNDRLYPVRIPYGQQLNVKFLFLKKSTFTS